MLVRIVENNCIYYILQILCGTSSLTLSFWIPLFYPRICLLAKKFYQIEKPILNPLMKVTLVLRIITPID